MQYISFFITDSVINNRFILSKLRSFCKFWALLNSIQDTLNIFQTYFTRFRSTWYDSTGESWIYLRVRLYREYTMSVWINNLQEKVRKNSLTKSRPDWCVVNYIFRLFGLLFYTFSNYKCCRGEGLSECFSNIFGAFYLFFPFSSFSPLPWTIDVNVLIQRFFHTVQLP